MVNNTGTTHLPSSVRSFQFPGLALSLSSSVPLSPTFSPLGLIRIPRHADLTFPPACVPLARHPEPPTVASLFLSLSPSLSLSLFFFRSTEDAILSTDDHAFTVYTERAERACVDLVSRGDRRVSFLLISPGDEGSGGRGKKKKKKKKKKKGKNERRGRKKEKKEKEKERKRERVSSTLRVYKPEEPRGASLMMMMVVVVVVVVVVFRCGEGHKATLLQGKSRFVVRFSSSSI